MYLQHDGGIRLAVVQRDEDLETQAGAIKIIWQYSSADVNDDNWIEGQVEVRADYALGPPEHGEERIPQNYTVSYLNE